MPRFDQMGPEFVEVERFDVVEESTTSAGPKRSRRSRRRGNLLTQGSVPMTVFAQDPLVMAAGGPVLAQVPVPAGRLQRGPRSHRFHVADVAVGTNVPGRPVSLHSRDPWVYRDRWAEGSRPTDPDALVADRGFRAQNVFAVASYTLALFEQHLGRPVPWRSTYPQLFLVPQARLEANAFYSREHNAVLFGWLPSVGDQPPLYTALSYDVIAHEVSHAILDGLRPRYTEPGLPDQLAFHEALADLVAMLSVFTLRGVAQHLLDPDRTGRVSFSSDAEALRIVDPEQRRSALLEGRAQMLKESPLARLAEQIGGRRATAHSAEGTITGRYPALRRSVELPAGTAWQQDPAFNRPHRRAEVLVAAFMQTLVSMWAGRLEPLSVEVDGLDASRVAEEGVKSARHLLAMLLRALDYLPPVELEFADVIDTVITADRRLAPDDEHGYRDALEGAFARFGITPPPHRIVDEDGVAAPQADAIPTTLMSREEAEFGRDPDAANLGIRYEHLNLMALRSSPEEVYQFLWNNAAALDLDVRLTTRVERVLGCSRVGPDGALVNEVIADYVQTLRTTAEDLPPGVNAPAGMPPDTPVELWGGGVLVFDQFGRFRLHQRKPILDGERQSRRLAHLFAEGIRGRDGGFGTSDGLGDRRRFSLLHHGSTQDDW
ncbi:MAG: hypothetical protein H0W56_00230 [Acidothermales bacterium]|nr:hypothetical protein [Acidothermales bacterium]